MISFWRSGTAVRCSIDLKIPHYETRVFPLQWETTDPVFAGLLTAEFDKQLHNELERIRREEYERGWKDAKSKAKKATFFGLGWS